jgi:hypothetical protein
LTLGKKSLDSITSVPYIKVKPDYVRLLTSYVDLPRVPSIVLESEVAINTTKSYAEDSGQTHPGPYGLKDFDFPAEIRFLFADMNNDPRILGTLTTVEDKGKYRTVLVGHYALQLKTKRLADWLRKWLWNCREVASGDQRKMSEFIIDQQEKGRFMLSIDLSNATDKLSRDLQIQLLVRMGVPRSYFDFLSLPCKFRFEEFLPETKRIGFGNIKYSNGQPMGLFLSFPMFELAHYVILKAVTARYNADFCICGDDVVISCDEPDSTQILKRYKDHIENFGGEISVSKSISSRDLCEGIGALYLKGYPKELRIPSGKLSILEATCKGFWLNRQIVKETRLGRAIAYSWLNTKERKGYTDDNRQSFNEFMVITDLSDLHLDALRALASHQTFPIEWYAWEDPPEGVTGSKSVYPDGIIPENLNSLPKKRGTKELKYVSLEKYRDARVTHKIISLYKQKEQ